jgi:hypothetical protein
LPGGHIGRRCEREHAGKQNLAHVAEIVRRNLGTQAGVRLDSGNADKPYYEPKAEGSWWVRLLAWTFILSITAGLAVFGVMVFFAARTHTRNDPAFQGFQGYWDRDKDDEKGSEHWRLDLSRAKEWELEAWQNDVEVVIDKGTWTKIGERTYRLDSKSGSRIAELSKQDEWVMDVDGVKYFRVVK